MEQVPRGLLMLAVCIALTVGCAGLERREQQQTPAQAPVEDAEPLTKPALRGSQDALPVKPELARPRAAAQPAAPPPVVPPPARPQPSASPAAKPAASPPLDLKSLEARPRQTQPLTTVRKPDLKNMLD